MVGLVAVLIGPAIPAGRRGAAQEEHTDRMAKVRQWLRGWGDWRLLLIGVVMLGVELGEGSANNWLTLAVRNGHGQTAAVAALGRPGRHPHVGGRVSMGFPLGMSAAAESGSNPAARVSVVASIGYFANLAGPPAIGILAQAVGLDHALWLIAVLFVAAFAVSGSFRPRVTPSPRPQANNI